MRIEGSHLSSTTKGIFSLVVPGGLFSMVMVGLVASAPNPETAGKVSPLRV